MPRTKKKVSANPDVEPEEMKVPVDKPEATKQQQTDRDEYTIDIVDDENFKKDITYLEHKDPNYVYRWLREEHKNLSVKTSNALHQGGGWQLVPRVHLLNLGYSERGDISPDGWCRRGDTILARMPKDLYNRKVEVKIKRANEPLDAVQRMIKKGDPNTGGSDIHASMRGIQTQEALKGSFK